MRKQEKNDGVGCCVLCVYEIGKQVGVGWACIGPAGEKVEGIQPLWKKNSKEDNRGKTEGRVVCVCSWLCAMQFKGQKRVNWARRFVGLINMGMDYGNCGEYGTGKVAGVMKCYRGDGTR